MTRFGKLALLAMFSLAAAGAVAQTEETPPTSSSSNPSSASSPHQRESTKQAMAGDEEQMMNDCIKKEQTRDASMSKDKAKKMCQDQIKSQSKSNRQY